MILWGFCFIPSYYIVFYCIVLYCTVNGICFFLIFVVSVIVILQNTSNVVSIPSIFFFQGRLHVVDICEAY